MSRKPSDRPSPGDGDGRPRLSRRALRGMAVALACAAPMLRWAGPAPGLRVYGETGAVLATIAVPDGFTLSFMHSINLSPVDEEFSANADGSITLERVLYNQMSTGMPSGDEDGFGIVDGRFATTPRRRLEEIAVRVSPVPGHTLTASGAVRPLTRWAPAGGLLVLRGTENMAKTHERTKKHARRSIDE